MNLLILYFMYNRTHYHNTKRHNYVLSPVSCYKWENEDTVKWPALKQNGQRNQIISKFTGSQK